MKILLQLAGGIGNVMEKVPLYLRLVQEYGTENIDVEYLKVYPTDSKSKADCFPCQVIPERHVQELQHCEKEYDKYDFIHGGETGLQLFSHGGGFIREFEDSLSEHDSEVERNLKALDYLGIDRGEMLRAWREKETEHPEVEYIAIHNGALNAKGWEAKRYPKMGELAWKIQKVLGIQCVSVGAKHEVVAYTTDCTGRTLRESASIIGRALLHISTDTGTYHIAATMEKAGVAIFTMTSQTKNYDATFHHTITTVQKTREELECCPCQWGYCWSPDAECLKGPLCQDIPVDQVFDAVKLTLAGIPG